MCKIFISFFWLSFPWNTCMCHNMYSLIYNVLLSSNKLWLIYQLFKVHSQFGATSSEMKISCAPLCLTGAQFGVTSQPIISCIEACPSVLKKIRFYSRTICIYKCINLWNVQIYRTLLVIQNCNIKLIIQAQIFSVAYSVIKNLLSPWFYTPIEQNI